MFEYFEQLDQQLLIWINSLNSPFLDQLMWTVSTKLFGIPFYLLFLFLFYKKFKSPKFIFPVIFAGLSVGLSDLISNNLFKKVFQRYRPSHNLDIADQLHYVNDYHGGMYGFVSSHSANMFALAMFVYLILKDKYKYSWTVFLWAFLIAYSRMYLGVHYPADIICGGALGVLIGWLMYKLLFKVYYFTQDIK